MAAKKVTAAHAPALGSAPQSKTALPSGRVLVSRAVCGSSSLPELIIAPAIDRRVLAFDKADQANSAYHSVDSTAALLVIVRPPGNRRLSHGDVGHVGETRPHAIPLTEIT
jgi:hypothetical protein